MSEVLRLWLSRALLGSMLFTSAARIAVGQESRRKARVRVEPDYPTLAEKMQISGTVKVEVTISASGLVVQKKVLGGNPLLVAPSMDALSKWKFEPGEREDKQIVEFHFARH